MLTHIVVLHCLPDLFVSSIDSLLLHLRYVDTIHLLSVRVVSIHSFSSLYVTLLRNSGSSGVAC